MLNTLYIIHIIFLTAPTRCGVHWHHFREATPNCKFFATHKMIINTCYNDPVLIIILYVATNLQLGVASRKWCQETPQRVGAVNNSMWFIIQSVEPKCLLTNCDMRMMHDIKLADINSVILRSGGCQKSCQSYFPRFHIHKIIWWRVP
jgi:hypothetical protein